MNTQEVSWGLYFDLECPYFACFRHPTSTSLIQTYPVPPFTTIRGLIACALGLPRNAFFLQDCFQIGLRPLERVEVTRELAKLLKLIPRDVERRPNVFPSSPMYRYFLARPAYRVYIEGYEEIIDTVRESLLNPQRPLYLGQSDDMVTISKPVKMEILQTQTVEVFSIIEGIYAGCELLKLPLRFEDVDTLVYTSVLSMPPTYPWKLEKPHLLWQFGTETVWLTK